MLKPVIFIVLLLSTSATAAAGQPPRLAVCTDYHCDRTVEVTLEHHHWHAITGMFKARTYPELERALIARSVALFERYVGDRAGTSGDLARNNFADGLSGQLDCISESKNTLTYLQTLMDAHLLRWHTVEDRVRRSSWVFDAHWTAVIQDKITTQKFAVDSWYLANGRAPYVQALDDWIKRAPLPQNPDAGEMDPYTLSNDTPYSVKNSH